MSDLDQLDRAFEALTRDLAHTHGPGAAAAVTTARKRRRTRVGAVALTALAVVGGGLAVPQLLSSGGGVAADGRSAPLDATALDAATDGWVDGWEAWDPASGNRDSFGAAECFTPDRNGEGPSEYGTSWFVTDASDRATMTLHHYATDGAAAAALDAAHGAPDSCGTTTTIEVDGVTVRHDSMARELAGPWLGDVWMFRRGSDVAEIEIASGAGPADADTARSVAEALVAGWRSGETQTASATTLEDQLSSATEGWTAGWQVPTSQGDPGLDALYDSCLDLYGPGAGYEKEGGHLFAAPGGAAAFAMFADYESEGGAQDFAAAFAEQLDTCRAGSITLPREGGEAIHGYTHDGEPVDLWLLVDRDRIGMVVVVGADDTAPDMTSAAVSGFLVTALTQDASYVSPTYTG